MVADSTRSASPSSRRAAHWVHTVIAPPSLTVSTRSATGAAYGSSRSGCRPGTANHTASPVSQTDTEAPAATPIAATVQAWFARSAASAPQVILIKSDRDVISVDMADIVAEGIAVLIRRFAGSAPWEARYGYSRVVVAGDWAITAGTTATGLGGVLHPGDPYQQALAAFRTALDALQAAGASPEQVVRTRMYVTDITSQAEIGRAHQEMLGHVRPVATMVEVARLADPAHLVEVEVEAYVGR
jgi:enamine deaminase RidA (YjgF/YER057c/UK114 family)